MLNSQKTKAVNRNDPPTRRDSSLSTAARRMAFNSSALIVIVVWSVIGAWMLVLAIACLCCTKKRRAALKTRLSYVNRRSQATPPDNNYLHSPVILTDEPTSHPLANTRSAADNKLSFNIAEVFEKTLKKTSSSFCIDAKRLITGSVIGQGQFGVVFHGQLRDKSLKNPREVAIKTVQGDRCNETDVSAFLEEVMRMKGFGHRNVLSMIGLVFKDNRPYVVLPYMDRGDVKSHISDQTKSFTVKDLLEIGCQIIDGMSYLAEQGFVHRDLAARNCMIDSSSTVKIADFGLSRDIFNEEYYKLVNLSQPLPVRWMAVESFRLMRFTHQSDVWSFGVVLWELLSRGCNPYKDMDNPTVIRHIKSGKRLDKPSAAPVEIYDIMARCWREEPTERPTFDELAVEFHDILAGRDAKKKPKKTKALKPKPKYYNVAVSPA